MTNRASAQRNARGPSQVRTSRHSSTWLGLVFLCIPAVVGFAERRAFAQSATSRTPAQHEAEQHDHRAFDALRRGDAEAARLELAASYALAPSSTTLWNLLVAEADSHHPLDALKHLKTYLADPQADPKKRERAMALRSDLMAQVGHLKIVVPSGVPVVVDGIRIADDPYQEGLHVAPGKHRVDAHSRKRVHHQDIEVPAGKVTSISFDIPADEWPASTESLSRSNASREPAAISSSSSSADKRSHGIHAPPLATWILAGVAVVGVGTGVGFSLSARSKTDEMDGIRTACASVDSPDCGRLHDLHDAAGRNSTIAWIAYGGAGAALIAGGLVWVLSPKQTSATGRPDVAPLAGPGLAGIRLQGSF